jgi:tetratricopeptide (TPR) repeat protein
LPPPRTVSRSRSVPVWPRPCGLGENAACLDTSLPEPLCWRWAESVGLSAAQCGRGVLHAVALLCLLLSLSQPLAGADPQTKTPAASRDVPALLKAASAALERQDLPAAVEALKSVLEIEPEMTAAWFNLAYAYSGLHQDEEALRAYQKTLELQPDLFEAQLNLGILLLQMKRAQESLAHLEKAVALRPEHARAHLYLGRALGSVGQSEAAEQQFQEALRLDPALAAGYFDLGQLHLGKKHYADALTAFEKAAESDPKLIQAQLGIALALEGLDRLPEAVLYFEQYLAAKPEDLATRFHMARLYLQQGKNGSAFENLDAVHRASPQMPGVAAALGDVSARLKKLPESEKYYREALTTAPQDPELHRALGQTLLAQERFVDAEAEFRTSLRLDPRNVAAAQGLASSLYLQKRYAEAIPLFEGLTRTPAAPAGLFFVLATCYDHLRDLPHALQAYEKFLELSENQRPDQEWQARQRVKLLRRELRK